MIKDRFLAIFLIIISVIVFFETSKFPSFSNEMQVIDASFVPRLLASFLIIASLILLVKSFKQVDNSKLDTCKLDKSSSRVLVIVILMIAYRYILPIIGFEITTILFLTTTMYLFKYKKILKAFLISLLVTIVIYYIFIFILNVPFPTKFF